MAEARRVACPRCGALTQYTPQNAWRPFCSERCKMIDLGAWASEKYRVAQEDKPGSEPDSTSEKKL